MRAVAPKRPRGRTAETVRSKYFPLKGGEDLISSSLSIDPGSLSFSLNYEPGIQQGYRRIDGIERLDGQPKPSEATYIVIPFTDGTDEPLINTRIYGVTSGAFGQLLAIEITSGSWAGDDAAGNLVVRMLSGDYDASEALAYVDGPFSAGLSAGFGI